MSCQNISAVITIKTYEGAILAQNFYDMYFGEKYIVGHFVTKALLS